MGGQVILGRAGVDYIRDEKRHLTKRAACGLFVPQATLIVALSLCLLVEKRGMLWGDSAG